LEVDPKEIVWEGVDWIHLAQDRDHWWAHVNMLENIPFLQNVGNFLND
jgi:hypothetical protein